MLFERRPAIGMKFLWTLAQVQSLRLDEALLWRTPAEGPDGVRPPGSRVAASSGTAEERKLSFAETLRGFPAPLSRRVG